MNSISIQQFLRRRTAETLTRLGQARRRETERRDTAPRPGDLFVFPATADFEVQWAVLDPHPERQDVLLVVPADLNPQVGSTDVAVPAISTSGAVASSGALTLRCRFGVWLPAAAFKLEMRTGTLPSEPLELARCKWAEIARGLARGSALERETDTEPEYQDWAEGVLAKAQATLAGLGEAAEEEGDQLFAGGVDGVAGEYLRPPAPVAEVVEWARRERIDPRVLRLLAHVHHVADQPHLGSESVPDLAGTTAEDPASAGWAIVFHVDEPAATREALRPLIEHRRSTAAGLVKELEYQSGEDVFGWLARHDVGAEEVRPALVPYFLLLVGSPAKIPYDFQQLIGVQYAVGRLSFDDPEEYRRYAESLINAETKKEAPLPVKPIFFGPRHASDPWTAWTAGEMVLPLARECRGARQLLADDATRRGLAEVFRGTAAGPGGSASKLIFCAGHGVVLPEGHAERPARQGAVVCQDWSGPGQSVASGSFGADEVTDDAELGGSMALFFSAFSAGTSAGEPMVAELPRRLLAHPRGGALAVVGLLGSTWSSMKASTSQELLSVWRRVLATLLAGRSVGDAIRKLQQRFAVLATELEGELEKMEFGVGVDESALASAWGVLESVRGCVVLGDPAARLRPGAG